MIQVGEIFWNLLINFEQWLIQILHVQVALIIRHVQVVVPAGLGVGSEGSTRGERGRFLERSGSRRRSRFRELRIGVQEV